MTGTNAPWAVAAIAVAMMAAACTTPARDTAGAPDAGPERIPLYIETESGIQRFSVEIADTEAERTQGLMFRTELSDRAGMLFIFENEAPRTFWMRNTLIPLDMIFIRADRRILGIVRDAEPETDTHRGVPGASQYVLELIGGSAARFGIEAGQTVQFDWPPDAAP